VRTLVDSGRTDGLCWETAIGEPGEPLARYTANVVGYDERTAAPLVRAELPGSRVCVLIELGTPLSVAGGETIAGQPASGGFVAGLQDAPVLTSHDGWQRGVQLDLSPTAATQLLGIPAVELRQQVRSLPGLTRERDLASQLREMPTWAARLGHVERWLLERFDRGARPDPRMEWAQSELCRSGGRLSVTELRQALAMSERHFITSFKIAVGVTPKRFARLVRFDAIKAHLRGPAIAGAELALAVGCYDQAHLAREVRSFSGLTPTSLRALLLGGPLEAALAPTKANARDVDVDDHSRLAPKSDRDSA